MKTILLLLFKVLDKSYQKKLLLLQFLVILNGLCEVLSLALIPFLVSLSASSIGSNVVVNYLTINFFDGDYETAKYLIGFSAFLFIAMSLFFRLFSLFHSSRLAANITNYLSIKAFESCISVPYSEYLSGLSGKILTVCSNEVQQVSQAIGNILLFNLNLTVSLILFTYLCVLNYKIAFVVTSFFAFFYSATYILARNRLAVNSKLHLTSNLNRLKYVDNALNSFRNILLDGSTDFFVSKYGLEDSIMRRVQATNMFISIAPRTILEFLVILSVAAFLLFQSFGLFSFSGLDVGEVLIFSLGVLRLLPNVQGSYNNFVSAKSRFEEIRSVANIIDSKNDIVSLPPISASAENQIFLSNVFKIEFQGVSFSYPGYSEKVIDNLTFDAQFSDVIGIKGISGSGKSTLIDLILGLLRPTSGRIVVNGLHDLADIDIRSYHELLSHIPQQAVLFNGSISENISISLKSPSLEDLQRASRIACADKFISDLPQGYNYQVLDKGINMSGGQCQRIILARGLFKTADVLVLDESTNALDKETESRILHDVIYSKGYPIIFITSHSPEVYDFCNKIIDL